MEYSHTKRWLRRRFVALTSFGYSVSPGEFSSLVIHLPFDQKISDSVVSHSGVRTLVYSHSCTPPCVLCFRDRTVSVSFAHTHAIRVFELKYKNETIRHV